MFKLKQFRVLLLIVMLASLTYLASSTSLAKKPVPEPEIYLEVFIPDHTIAPGGTFLTIELDKHVSYNDQYGDPVETQPYEPSDMIWTIPASTDNLTVSYDDQNREVTIAIVDDTWTGYETLTFTATDPAELSGQDDATFTVTTDCVWDEKYPISLACEVGCEECLNADFPECFRFPVGFSLCAETLLRRLSNVSSNPTAIEFSIANTNVSFESVNPQCNAPPAQGSVFIGDKQTIYREITQEEVAKNGTAVISDLCFTYDFFKNLVKPNPQWTNCWLDLGSFDVGFVLTQNGEPAHVIWGTCAPNACDTDPEECTRYGDCEEVWGVDLNCTTICDSQDDSLNVPPCCDPDGVDPDLPACPEPE